MAMYEGRGYCPSNAFWQRMARQENISPLWAETMELLGDRIGYMVYTANGNSITGECYIVDALMGAKGTLGIQIAAALKQIIPTCIYAEKGCPIVCTDLLNPNQILSNERVENGKWTCLEAGRKTCSGQDATSLYEDERYFVLIQEGKDEVRIYLYKKVTSSEGA